jgi:phage gp29-like protein
MAFINASKDNLWRENLNPLRGLTMERIVRMIEEGERGAFADVQWFYQSMERADSLIATVIARRKAALMSAEWNVRMDETPKNPGLAQEQADFLMAEYDRIGNLRQAVAFLSSAAFRGYAHLEKHFGKKEEVARLEPVEQWFWCRKGMFGEWQYNAGAKAGAVEGTKIKRENFILLESPCALDRMLAIYYFRRNLALKDWDGYLEIYGIPSLFFVGPPGATTEKEKLYAEIAEQLASAGRGYLPNGTTVTHVNGGGSGRAPFSEHLSYLDKQIALLGTGGTLTMLAESGSGTLAGNAQQDAFDQIAQSDASVISEAFQRDFDAPLLESAFPGWPVEAYFEISIKKANPYGLPVKKDILGRVTMDAPAVEQPSPLGNV